MPANLTPQYLAAEARYRSATTPEEKLEALQEMMATIPKHKGTEKLRAEIKQKLSKLKKELASGSGKKMNIYRPGIIEKEGAAQIAVVGPPNTGKSTLLKKFTNANVHVTDFPFGTIKPETGMMPFEDIQFQLIDTPPLFSQYHESYLLEIIHRCDVLLLMVDPFDQTLDEINFILDYFEDHKIRLHSKNLNEYQGSFLYKNTLVFMNKKDLDEDNIYSQFYTDLFSGISSFYPISLADDGNLAERIGKIFFEKADIVRVYSKEPGKKPDLEEPFILKKGSTLMDLAQKIHKDFIHFRFARVWGEGKYEGQPVAKDYVLQDKDIIEIHI